MSSILYHFKSQLAFVRLESDTFVRQSNQLNNAKWLWETRIPLLLNVIIHTIFSRVSWIHLHFTLLQHTTIIINKVIVGCLHPRMSPRSCWFTHLGGFPSRFESGPRAPSKVLEWNNRSTPMTLRLCRLWNRNYLSPSGLYPASAQTLGPSTSSWPSAYMPEVRVRCRNPLFLVPLRDCVEIDTLFSAEIRRRSKNLRTNREPIPARSRRRPGVSAFLLDGTTAEE